MNDKEIEEVQKKLGLDQLAHIPKSYAALIMDMSNQ